MPGELLGLSFGTYTGTINDLKKTYYVKPVQNPQTNGNQHEFKYYDKDTGFIKGNGFKETISFNNHNQAQYANSAIFKDGLLFGTKSKSQEGLDTFDYIAGKNEYAIDINGNGKVDENEVFNGKIDIYVYTVAKDSGDLNNYRDYLKLYNK